MNRVLNQILVGNAPVVMAERIPDESIDCVVTSPPYWSLRDYGKITKLIWNSNNGCLHEWQTDMSVCDNLRTSKVSTQTAVGSNKELSFRTGKNVKNAFCSKCGAWQGQLGLEPHFELYIKHLVSIFDVVYRKLKMTGSLWVNLGDTYGGSGNANGHTEKTFNFTRTTAVYGASKGNQANTKGMHKSLLMIPERFALNMQKHGWIVRNRIIWEKPNCMPRSATDRFTDNYEFIYHFVKSRKTQFWVNEVTLQAVSKRPAGIHGIEGTDWKWIIHNACQGKGCKNKRYTYRCVNGYVKSSLWNSSDYYFEQQFEPSKYPIVWSRKGSGPNTPYDENNPRKRWGKLRKEVKDDDEKSIDRNMRSTWGMNFEEYMDWCEDNWYWNEMLSSVWNIKTIGFKPAHFACYPRKLVKTPIESSCPKEICNKCGLPRVKVYRATGEYDVQGGKGSKTAKHLGVSPTASILTKEVKIKEFVGYSDCGCGAGFHPGVVMDPFVGSGTTCEVAETLARNWIGIDINPDYVKMAYQHRLKQRSLGI